MVRRPLTVAQHDAGRRLGASLRAARGDRKLDDIARAANISPETLRKIETGRLPTPAFGTIVLLSAALDVPITHFADSWR